jgi:hypothetical protein
MKSIKNTLGLLAKNISRFSEKKRYNIRTSLIGGQAVISYGVPRVTFDIDICVVMTDAESNYVGGKELADFLQKELPYFKVEFKKGADFEDPLKHDLIRLQDPDGNYPLIDILFANYKWELEGLEKATKTKGIPMPIFPMPYLVMMKLKAGGLKDYSDIIDVFELMTEKDKKETFKLAHSLRLDKKLTAVLEKFK